MTIARPLPSFLAKRYHGWKATIFAENKSWYRRLVDEGQRPRVMVVSCCDSRVNINSIFGAEPGEIFLHRNIANLVPPYAPSGGQHGTSAALEYAVTALHVAHIIIIGHSSCGGVQGCHDMCTGTAPELEDPNSFLGRWMDVLRPGFARVEDIEDDAKRIEALEKQAVIVSLENLIGFPFVKAAVEAEELSLHGLWNDISAGSLEFYDSETDAFAAV
jgi:carbonic anhydrase